MIKLRGYRNRTFRARFTVRKFKTVRNIINDTITFGIYNDETGVLVPGTNAVTGTGITQSEDGDATITLDANVMSFAAGSQYRFEITITEGDTGEKATLALGTFTLEQTYNT